MEVADTPQRRADRGQRLGRVAAVEDERDVGAPGVAPDPVDDGVAADLLLRVDREADGHRQLARGGEQLGRAEQHEEMRLVVGHAPCHELAVPLHQRPWIGLPQGKRIRGLDVEVRVDEHGRRQARRRRGHLAEDERPAPPLLDLDRAAGAADPVGDPVGCPPDVVGVRVVGAHGRDRDELRQLGDEVLVRRNHPRDCRDGARPASYVSEPSCGSSSATAPERLGCLGRRGSRTPAPPTSSGPGKNARTPCPRRRSHQARRRRSITRRRGRSRRRRAHAAS